MTYMFDLFKTYAATVLQVTITGGVFVVFAYWAFSINFYPAGVTLSESLFFIFAALMFGLIYSLWYLLAIGTLHGLFHWRSKHIKFDWGMFLLGLVAASLLSIAAGASQSLKVLAPLVGAMVLLTITWYWEPLPLYTPTAIVKKRQRDKVLFTIMAIFIPMLFVPDVTAKIIVNSMQRLGFRQMDVSVSLDAGNQKIINDMVEEFDLRLHNCGNRQHPERIVNHVNVLWHGMGERTLIEMPFITDSSGSPYQVELNRSGVNVIRRSGYRAGIPLCFTLDNDLLFDPYAFTLIADGTAALSDFAEKVKTYLEHSKRHITAIAVTGHSDRNPVRVANDSNQKLSHRRAESVAKQLQSLSPNLRINIMAAGSHTSISNCARDLPKAELSECLAMDRRVEIVVLTQPL